MPFAATWKDLEITILSKVRQRQVPYNITYMWNLNTNQLIYTTETNLQTYKANLQLPNGKGGKGKG